MIADTTAATDDPVWESLKKGDPAALGQLYETHITSLLGFGLSLTPDRDLVKDCIQELFITLWNQHSRLSRAHSVRLYLLVSLKRLILRQLRKIRTSKNTLSEQAGEDGKHEFPAEYYIMENEAKRKRQILLSQEIGRLPKRQMEAVFLRFYEELSYEEIAGIMNLNYQGARNIIYKSVKTLRRNMQHKWPHILLPLLFLSPVFFRA